ncbi:MAG: hypothetical protein WD873_03965, partial [Candidatus Hydrogenedentales bacterium]
MLPREGLRAAVVKAPHHGSKSSSTEAFMRATAPRAVVISAGRRLGGKVVSMDVARRYAAQGAEIFRTDAHGGIQLRLKDGRLIFETARGQRGYPIRQFNYAQ